MAEQFNKSRLIRLDSDHYTLYDNYIYRFYLHSSDEATHEVSRIVLKSLTMFNVQQNVNDKLNTLDLRYNGVDYTITVPPKQYNDISSLRTAIQNQINLVVGIGTITMTVDPEGIRFIVSVAAAAVLILYKTSTIRSIVGFSTDTTISSVAPVTMTFCDLSGVGEVLVKSPEIAFSNMIQSDKSGNGLGKEESVFTTILFNTGYGGKILFNSPHHRASDILYKNPRDLRMISISFEDERSGTHLDLWGMPWSMVLQIYY
jgi:hypothetical protein